MKPLKSLIVCVFSLLLMTACVTTDGLGRSTGTETEHKSYYGTWTIMKVVLKNGEIKDLTNGPIDYVHIRKSEIAEEISGYGIKNYNYIATDNTLIVMAGNRMSTWKIIENTKNTMEIETPAGRYILSR